MICTMDRSSGKLLGYSVSGDVTKGDFGTLVPAVAAVVKDQGSVCLLLDLNDLHREKLDALSSQMDFAKQFLDEIEKMAIVGNDKWEKPAATLCKKLGVSNWKFFETNDDAWTWLGA